MNKNREVDRMREFMGKPKIKDELSKEEVELLERLAKPNKCMHHIIDMQENESHWKCNQCGLIAKKTLPSFVTNPEPLGNAFKKVYYDNKWELYRNDIMEV